MGAGKARAHQIINTGTSELKYLAVSTKLSPDNAEYPVSGKFAVLAEYPAGPDGNRGCSASSAAITSA